MLETSVKGTDVDANRERPVPHALPFLQTAITVRVVLIIKCSGLLLYLFSLFCSVPPRPLALCG